MTTENVTTFVAPLFGFDWSGTEMQLADGLWIRSLDPEPILTQHKDVLSDLDVAYCRQERHWLCADLPASSTLGEAEVMNLFVLALWAHKPAQVLLAYRFQTQPAGPATRLLDRLTREHVDSEVTDADLEVASSYLAILRKMVIASPRAKATLLLTLHGRTAHAWQVAFICFAAALESALTYFGERDGQITERLARAYVAIIDPPAERREEIHKEFKRLYGVRSKIVHEAAYDRKDAQKNLDDLAKLTDLLRSLWRVACRSEEVEQYVVGQNSFRQTVLQKRNGLLENSAREHSEAAR